MATAFAEPYLTVWLAAACCLAAVVMPRLSRSALGGAEAALARAARHKLTCAVCLFAMVIAVRLALIPRLPVPNPGIHDEFSYLLMADTFAHGRLANPTHAMWRSFETFHVLWHPTYASKYPPAQGAVLAIGQILGQPWIGVLLSTAAMCVAIFWALRPFLPGRWALLAALLAWLRLGIASYWMNSYWGGSVAATGGAMLLGGAGRIFQGRGLTRNSFLLAIGLAILANSRPFEGLAFCAPMVIALLWRMLQRNRQSCALRAGARQVAYPLVAMGIATLMFMGYYNWRVTRNPWLMPHVLAGRQYDRSALFVWNGARPAIEFGNAQLNEFYNGWERENYDRSWSAFWRISSEKLWRCRDEFLWTGLLLITPGFLLFWRNRRFRVPLLALLATLLGFSLLGWWNPHYIAPATCVLYAAIAQAVRHVRAIRLRGRPLGAALVVACCLSLAADIGVAVHGRASDPLGWGGTGLAGRGELEKRLGQAPGQHLVVVRYAADHSVHEEWVYNGAEIDSQKVVWARELDAAQNARLLSYYQNRHAWLLQPDQDDSDLEPYRAPTNAIQ